MSPSSLKHLLCCIILVLIVQYGMMQPAHADYVEVSRAATIKSAPLRDADILERPPIGTRFQLLDGGLQKNGYYRVIRPFDAGTGWVYRTLVRRYRDTPASDERALPAVSDATTEVIGGDSSRLHFVDVGQGDATIIEFSCGLIMVDAGGQNEETTNRLVEYLDNLFTERPDLDRTIDTVFVTHTHVDHNRSLNALVEKAQIRVLNYVHNGVLSGSGDSQAKWMLEHGNDDGRQIFMRSVDQAEITLTSRVEGLTDNSIDAVNCSSVDPKVRLLAGPYKDNPGWPQGHFDDGNNKSLVIRVDFGKSSFLFTGDLEESAIETLVEYYAETSMLDVDVYQVGHHGSHNGTTETLLMAMTPQIATISMSSPADQRWWTGYIYGHPRRTVVDLLDKWISRPRENSVRVPVATGMRRFHDYHLRDAVYATGWDGTIRVVAHADGTLRVQTLGRKEYN